MKSTSSFLIGLISGAAIGAALGILYAPDKGEITRKKITKKAEDLKDEFYEKMDEMKEYFNESIDSVKEKVDDIKEKMNKKEKPA
ncbi:MAG TPA: YtxH domain-containing protein [Bacteroidales bacterium]|nr:YtxH domain-containing protein [Bacteroidales bacterium]HPR58103.1 YtxH domain-containing protein [Bacteroidales bacterium]HRW96928.1 YtxH domain-containing protein [Bacteroidales bacterium]